MQTKGNTLMTNHEFINRLRSLYNIDHNMLPELTDKQWPEFRDNPPRYLTHTDKNQSDAILREVEKRQTLLQNKPNFDITLEGKSAYLSIGIQLIQIPCT